MPDAVARPPKKTVRWDILYLTLCVLAWLLALFFTRRLVMLSSAIVLGFALLQFYRTVLLLLVFGGSFAFRRMRKWRLSHWNHGTEPTHDAGQHHA